MKLKKIHLAIALLSVPAMSVDLSDVYSDAEQYDTSLLKATSQHNIALEDIDESRAALLPQLTANAFGGATNSDIVTDDYNTYGANIQLNQLIFNHAAWVGLDMSTKKAALSEVKLGQAKQALALNVASAYFNVLRWEDELELVRKEKMAVAKQRDQVEQRHKVGLASITAVHEAQAQLDATQAQEIIVGNSVLSSYEALRKITGVEYQKIDSISNELDIVNSTDKSLPTWVTVGENNSPALVIAKMEKDIAKDVIKIEESGFMPTVGMSASYQTADINHSISDMRVDEGSVFLNVSLPLYQGGATTSRVKQAQYSHAIASESLEFAHRGMIENIRNSYHGIESSRGAIKAYSQSVKSAESALAATEAGFNAGTRTIVDVLNSTKELYNANGNLLDSKYNYILSDLKLRYSAGVLSTEDILRVNSLF
ncbi:TolC family outer membrane protein [Vibrio crassostreae]|uniref:TolC family outer membrane protein n=1 Tax=Vibrio crassostreae TaxID=246167 RepID=UPI001B30D24F|nr:TolC family outer membrane protein [Vibrio crassostreae]